MNYCGFACFKAWGTYELWSKLHEGGLYEGLYSELLQGSLRGTESQYSKTMSPNKLATLGTVPAIRSASEEVACFISQAIQDCHELQLADDLIEGRICKAFRCRRLR